MDFIPLRKIKQTNKKAWSFHWVWSQGLESGVRCCGDMKIPLQHTLTGVWVDNSAFLLRTHWRSWHEEGKYRLCHLPAMWTAGPMLLLKRTKMVGKSWGMKLQPSAKLLRFFNYFITNLTILASYSHSRSPLRILSSLKSFVIFLWDQPLPFPPEPVFWWVG